MTEPKSTTSSNGPSSRIEKRGGYPSGNKPVSQMKPPPSGPGAGGARPGSGNTPKK